MALTKDQILDGIAELSVIELKDLLDAFEEKFGVTAAAPVAVAAAGGAASAAPVTHIWYFKGVPSRLGYLLDLAPKDLEKVIYFAAYMITEVDTEARAEDMPTLEKKYASDYKYQNKRNLEEIGVQ